MTKLNLKNIFLLTILNLIIISSKKYDVVIIGLGSAGETYAWKLDQFADKDIYIIDHSDDEINNPDLKLIDANSLFTVKTGQHNPLTVFFSREQLRSDVEYRQAKGLGGILQVGSASYIKPSLVELEFWKNNFSDVLGIWNYSYIDQGLRNIENFSDPSHPNRTISPNRGISGPIKFLKNNAINDSSLNDINLKFMDYFNVTYIPDANANEGSRIGITEFDRAYGHNPDIPVQNSIYKNYLKNNTNITISSLSTVVAIKFKVNHHLDTIKATEVHYLEGGECKIVKLKKDGWVVLAAGIMTPLILEKSGIGNCSHLEELGIDCIYDNVYVGENWRDHPILQMQYSGAGFEDKNSARMNLFYRSPAKPGLYELQDSIIAYLTVRTGSGTPSLFILANNVELNTTGSIHIQKSDPLYVPLLNLNYSTQGFDGDHYVWMFRTIRQIFADLNITEVSPGLASIPNSISDTSLKSRLLGLLTTNWHGSGTATFPQVTNETNGRVNGIKNLYVIDASFHKFTARQNPNGLIRGIAYKMAEIHHDIYS